MAVTGAPDASLIRGKLEKILASNAFRRAEQLSAFLRFVVEKTLEGAGGSLKETVIGAEVFGRPAGYDPKSDPIVRNQARRLRVKLDDYEQQFGAGDAVTIRLPVGSYQPEFELHEQPSPEIGPAPVLQRYRWAFVILGVALVSGAIGYLLTRVTPRNEEPSIRPATSYPGFEYEPSLSPDGSSVAFSWNSTTDNFSIYIKDVDGEQPRRLTSGSANDSNPAWSPDGKTIAFLRYRSEPKLEVVLTPVAGGPERVIGEIRPRAARRYLPPQQYRWGPGPSWSRDGKYVAVADGCESREDTPDCIYLLAVNGPERRRVTQGTKGSAGDTSPALSPWDDRLVFVRAQTESGMAELWLKDLAGSAEQQITHDGRIVHSIAWRTPGELLFTSNRSGAILLWRMPIGHGSPTAISAAGRQVRRISADRMMKRVIYSDIMRNTNVWRAQIQGSPPQADRVEKLLASSRQNDSAEYSPDGGHIAFISDRTGSQQVWVALFDGSMPSALTGFEAGTPVGSPRWSPNGNEIAFDSTRDGRSVIYRVPAKGGEPKLFASDDADCMMPTWSRDGKFIYYIRSRNGQSNLMKRAVTGGSSVLVINDVTSDAIESFDGSTLFFGRRPGIWWVPIAGGEPKLVPQLADVNYRRFVTMSRKGLWWISNDAAHINFFELGTSVVHPVVGLSRPLPIGTPSCSVTPDGRSLIYSTVDDSGSDLMLLEFR